MKKTIMIVDNDRDTRFTIKTILKKNQYKVISTANCNNCLEKIKKHKPNFILMGCYNPRKEVLEAVKKTKGLKIIYLITDEEREEKLALYKNVIGFIKKPFNVNNFLKQIEKMTN